jgi:hypothetical protein
MLRGSKSYQQEESFAHSHVDLLPWSAPNIIPAAQPTPDFTEIASEEQFLPHAPHSIQASRTILDYKNAVRTNFSASSAACTLLGIEL